MNTHQPARKQAQRATWVLIRSVSPWQPCIFDSRAAGRLYLGCTNYADGSLKAVVGQQPLAAP